MANLIKKHNTLNEAYFDLTVSEYRIILMGIYICRIRGLNPMTDRIRFHVSDYNKSFGLGEDNSNGHVALINGTLSLKTKMLIIRQPDNILKGKMKVTFADWVSEVSYIENAGFVEIMFSQRVAEHLLEDESRYTLYDLLLLSKLSSFYAIRIFEHIMQWRTVGKTQVYDIGELKNRMGIGLSFPTIDGMSEPNVKYVETKLFNRDVIGRAIKLINKHTDLELDYNSVKKGREVTGGYFTFNKAASAVTKPREVKLVLEQKFQEEEDNDGLPKLKF